MKIAMVCPVGIEISPDSLRVGSLGGSETALICMATELSKLDHEVHIYAPMNTEQDIPGVVSYHPIGFWERDYNSNFDVAIFSRDVTRGSLSPTNAKLRIYWLHDMPGTEIQLKQQIGNLWYIDEIFVLSDYHRNAWTSRWNDFPYFTWKTRNGVDHALIKKISAKRSPLKFLYSSCPERGLLPLLKSIWPRLLTKYPEAQLNVCGYDVPQHVVPAFAYNLRQQLFSLAEHTPNCKVLGHLTKSNLYWEMKSSAALLYPCDFPEISCITAMEAMACGTPIITTDRFALHETLPPGYLGLVDNHPKEDVYTQAFLDRLDVVLANYNEVVEQGLEFSKRYDWSLIAQEWDAHFKEYLQDPERLAPKTVSCCMIIKDEEENIAGAINSVAPHVDEVRILDTGSTDHTLEIVEKCRRTTKTPIYVTQKDYGDNFEFDTARSDSIADTKSDWILWMDADERLIRGQNIRKYIRNRIFNGFIIRQHQFAIDLPPNPEEPVRMFRNIKIQVAPFTESIDLVKFVGVIHEHPEFGINEPVNPVLCIGDIDLAHFGYITEEVRREKVRTRNLTLLLKDREKWPDRLLGKILVMRDLVHMFEWGVERGAVNHDYLHRCISIYHQNFAGREKEFEDMGSAVLVRGFEWYQRALKYCVRFNAPYQGHMPFCARMLLSVKAAGMPENNGETDTRWFLTNQEFAAFMGYVTDKTLKQVKMELEPFS